MDGIYFAAALVAVLLLLWWYIRSDTDDENLVTRGLFGMRDRIKRAPPFRAKHD